MRQVMTIKAGDHVLERFGNGLGALGEGQARRVMVRAINRTGNPALTAVRRELARATSAPLQLVKQHVYARKAWAGDGTGPGRLEFQIIAHGRPLPLAVFRPKEFRYGVRARVWGRFQRFEGAFMKGGRWPARVDLAMGGHVFVRSSAQRLPIERAYGPSLPKELLEPAIVKAFAARAAKLGDAIAHELNGELSKFS